MDNKAFIPINDLSRGFRLFQEEYESKAIEVLRSGWYILGNEVKRFEAEFAEALSDDCFAAGVDNGLDAILLGLIASGIRPGDEIIVQANGYIATLLGIVQCGAVPVFVEPNDDYQMDPECIERAITKKTKAVLVTQLYGMTAEMDAIMSVCRAYGLKLFEDCAQAHFAEYNGTKAGLFGDASFFSFYPTKTIGGFGDGGMVVSGNPDIIEKVMVLRNYGSDYRYHNIVLGYNSRLDELQAGLLRIKLSHRNELIQRRSHIAGRYLEEMKNSRVRLPSVPENRKHIWYQFVVSVDEQEAFMQHMKGQGIATDISWKTPAYLQPCIVDKFGYGKGDYPITDRICDSIVSLPLMDVMNDEEVDRVISAVNSY